MSQRGQFLVSLDNLWFPGLETNIPVKPNMQRKTSYFSEVAVFSVCPKDSPNASMI